MTYSLRRPLEGLSWLQLLVWPLIFAQLCALKLWVRTHHGRGLPYRIAITRFGQVRLVRLPTDATLSYAAPGALRIASVSFSSGLVRPAFLAAYAPEDTPRAPEPDWIIRIRMESRFSSTCALNTS